MAEEPTGAGAWLRRTLRMAAMSAWTSGIVGGATIAERFVSHDRRDDLTRAYLARWVVGARSLVGMRLTVVGGDEHRAPRPDRARIVIANHRTPLDVLVLMSLFSGHFLANHKTRAAPIVGHAAQKIGTVFVDREDKRSGAQAVRAMRRLLEERRTIVVFPEGTTYRGDLVRPFKGGAFVAASGMSHVDVVPVGIAYPPNFEFTGGSLGAHARAFLARAQNPAWVSIGEPIAFPAQRRGVEDRLRDAVQQHVAHARAASGHPPTLVADTPASDDPTSDEPQGESA